MSKLRSSLLLAGGILGLLILACLMYTKPRSQILNAPVSLAVSHTSTPPFTPDIDYNYNVKIKFSSIRKPQFICLIGEGNSYPFYPFSCNSRPVLDVSWSIIAERRVVAHGDTLDNLDRVEMLDHGNGADRILGTFYGKKGQSYVLQMTFGRNARVLDAYHPSVSVEALPSLAMRGAVLDPLLLILSLVMTLVGLITLKIPARKKRALM